jgi:general secretion pathway protein G
VKIRTRKQTGFTLIEIMLVVAIITLLLGTAIYKFSPIMDWVKATRVQSDIRAIRAGLQTYQSTNGFYPTTDQGLDALVNRPQVEPIPERWFKFMESVAKDPWATPYVYRCPGTKHPESYDLFSAGPDRIPDTADDDWGQ